MRGELWHIVARLAGPEELRLCLPLAKEDAKNRAQCLVLSWGVMHFLMRCEHEGLANLRQRLSSEHPISRSLLAPILSEREFIGKSGAVKLLKGKLMEQLAGARELQKRQITLNTLRLRRRQLSKSCNTTLLSLGVIRRSYRADKDYINEKLVVIYGCQDSPIWLKLLGTEYEHALQILIEAEARFSGSYSEWLSLQDSFNDIVVRQFFYFLRSNNLDGHSKVVGRNGQLVKYGSLIAEYAPFDNHYPSEAKAFRILHERRNKLPGSHPYDQKGGGKNSWLKKNERDSFIPALQNALNNIAKVVEQNI